MLGTFLLDAEVLLALLLEVYSACEVLLLPAMADDTLWPMPELELEL